MKQVFKQAHFVVKGLFPFLGKEIETEKIADVVSKHGRVQNVTVVYHLSDIVDPGDLVTSGYYDDDGIELYISFCPSDKKIILDEHHIASIFDTLVHEFIHRKQNFLPDSAFKDEWDYYGKPEEIEAYGYNIASNLIRNYGVKKNEGLEEILTSLAQDIETTKALSYSVDFYTYKRLFSDDEHKKVMEDLRRKIEYHFIYLREKIFETGGKNINNYNDNKTAKRYEEIRRLFERRDISGRS